jgi:hypothetical protein
MNIIEFLLSLFMGFMGAIFLLIITDLSPKAVQEKFEKEAFSRGYMEKIINDKDQVIYRWKENQ